MRLQLAHLFDGYFNPRSLAGATATNQATAAAKRFQSTLPRGSDHKVAIRDTADDNFNPRSLAGATECKSKRQLAYVFQSTLPRGSDRPPPVPGQFGNNFNPRSLAGATTAYLLMAMLAMISIHAPSRERLMARILTST